MSLDRNGIYAALFTLITPSGVYQTVGQRLQFVSNTLAQPALFLRRTDDDYPPREVRMPRVKVTLNAEIWVYYKASGPEDVPAIMLDTLVSGVEDALRPPPLCDVQTLNGLVSHCWIEGRVLKDDGALSGQAMAMIPVKILAIS